jgi:uncharacterized ubiquitin-like protein YukD
MLLDLLKAFIYKDLRAYITTFIDLYHYVYRPISLRLSTYITTFIDHLTTTIFNVVLLHH